MSVSPVPEGYHTVTPYLLCPEVRKILEFLEKAFEGAVLEKVEQPDGRVMHAVVQVGDSRIMLGDPQGKMPALPAMIHLYLPDCDTAYQRALEAGATSVQPLTDQWYGDRSGGVQDAAGNLWWIATHTEDLSPEEMKRRMEAAMKQGGACGEAE